MNSEVVAIWRELNELIERYTNETISRTHFRRSIDELNKNEFGIVINKDIITDNREDFNEKGYVSYESYEESYDEDEDNYGDNDPGNGPQQTPPQAPVPIQITPGPNRYNLNR